MQGTKAIDISSKTLNRCNIRKHAYIHTVVPVMNGHPRDQAKVSVHSRWPLTTGVAQGRYYCTTYATLQGPMYTGTLDKNNTSLTMHTSSKTYTCVTIQKL